MSDGRACAVVTLPSTNVRAHYSRPGGRARRMYVRTCALLIFALHVKLTSQTHEIRDAIPDKLLPALPVYI